MSSIYKLLQRISKKFYQKDTILFLSIEKNFETGVANSNDDTDIHIQQTFWKDYQDSCSESTWLENKRGVAEQRLLQDHQLYFARRGGLLVHVCWVRVSDVVEATYELGPQAKFSLASPAPIIYDAWTPKEARGEGIYTQVVRRLILDLHKTYQEIWVYCADDNIASKTGLERAGFRVNCSMTSLLLLRLPTRLWFKKHDD